MFKSTKTAVVEFYASFRKDSIIWSMFLSFINRQQKDLNVNWATNEDPELLRSAIASSS